MRRRVELAVGGEFSVGIASAPAYGLASEWSSIETRLGTWNPSSVSNSFPSSFWAAAVEEVSFLRFQHLDSQALGGDNADGKLLENDRKSSGSSNQLDMAERLVPC